MTVSTGPGATGQPVLVEFDEVSVTYAGAERPTLVGADLALEEGELVLVVGATGSGKSTFLRCINGLVPHFTGGTLGGRVRVAGRDTRDHRPRDLADVVGYVGQVPLAGFVTDNVEDELAYAMESLGLSDAVMRKRMTETLDLLGIADLRGRPLAELSGGQQQRVAIGSVMTVHPSVLVLDEPTSALDPLAAEDVLATLQRLVHDLGLTVVIAEHRLERVVQHADRVVWLPGEGRPPVVGEAADILRRTPVAPPVVALGRLAGWEPLPLTVRDARRRARPLRERLAGLPAPDRTPATESADVLAELRGVVAGYGRRTVLDGVDLQVRRGEIVAVMGRNGAGKSTLLRTLVGLHQPRSGRRTAARAGMVPQVPSDILYAPTVGAECRSADEDAGLAPGATRALLERLAPGIPDDRHPRDLSEGQRLEVALAVVLATEPELLLLDEPTRGLDYAAKRRLVEHLRAASSSQAVLLATHDVELVAEVATRVVVLGDGQVVADGPAADVVVSSPAFAPQVAKVLAPQPWLTVDDVATAFGVTTGGVAP